MAIWLFSKHFIWGKIPLPAGDAGWWRGKKGGELTAGPHENQEGWAGSVGALGTTPPYREVGRGGGGEVRGWHTAVFGSGAQVWGVDEAMGA